MQAVHHPRENYFQTCVLKGISSPSGFVAVLCVSACFEELHFFSRSKMSCPAGPEWENSVSSQDYLHTQGHRCLWVWARLCSTWPQSGTMPTE